MNRGLLWRAFRESWSATLLLGVLLFGIESLLAFILPRFGAQMGQEWLKLDFTRGLIQAMLGTQVADILGPSTFQSIAWVHPVPLALLWAHAIVTCTRVPAGEVDRGTVDVLLGLPISRWELFLAEGVVWLASGAALMIVAIAGNLLGGSALMPSQRPELPRLLLVAGNLFSLYLAVGGFTWLISSLSERRGRAMTTVFVFLLVLFLLNYLAQFWQPAERLAFLSPLHYHRPLQVLTHGTVPWQDLSVLLSSAVIFWLAAGILFARRDLCTT